MELCKIPSAVNPPYDLYAVVEIPREASEI